MKTSLSLLLTAALMGGASAAVVTNGFVQNQEQNWSHLVPGTAASQLTEGSGGVPARAIDGNYNGAWSGGSVTHTDATTTTNWWQVDLGAARPISEVTLFNRTDSCCTGRLSNYSVLASNSSTFAGPHIYDSGNVPTAPTGASIGFSPIGVSARYVRVQRNATSLHGDEVVSLAEVDVKGQFNYSNLAIGSTASQSSLAASGVPSRAIDGNTNGDYNGALSTTHTDPNAVGAVWWETTLAAVSRINEISLYNRSDCCGERLGNFRVSVFNGASEVYGSNHFVGSGNVAEGGIFSIQEDTGGFFALGDRVRVELIGGINNSGDPKVLSLTEVEIYGAAIPEPSAFALFGLGGLGLILRRRRK